jgi:hypothetical protein
MRVADVCCRPGSGRSLEAEQWSDDQDDDPGTESVYRQVARLPAFERREGRVPADETQTSRADQARLAGRMTFSPSAAALLDVVPYSLIRPVIFYGTSASIMTALITGANRNVSKRPGGPSGSRAEIE